VTSTQQRPTTVGTTSRGARLGQAAMAVGLTVVSVLLLVTTHRLEVAVLGVDLPAGLLFGAAFQVVVCLFLWASTGTRFPLLVLGALWGLLAGPFLGEGAGGGVLMPAEIAGEVQLSGWVVQAIGIGIPFLVALALTLVRRTGPRAR
jgi:hypothetical protein